MDRLQLLLNFVELDLVDVTDSNFRKALSGDGRELGNRS